MRYGAGVHGVRVQVRDFRESDYPVWARLYNSVYPGTPKGEAELRYLDARFRPPYLQRRLVAEVQDRLVGWSDYAQHAASYHPQRFSVGLGALSEDVRTTLYDALLDQVQAHRPTELKTEVDEAQADFFSVRGFREVKRNWTLYLDLSAFDETVHIGRLEVLKTQGYSFSSFAELERTPEGTFALFELLRELVADVPSAVPRQPWSFEEFLRHRQDSPILFPEGSLVVRQGETLVGVSELKRAAEASGLMTSLTGVRKEFRGRGLALAAKAQTLLQAKALGFAGVSTQNASSNLRMLALNEGLGFKKTRTLVELVKVS